MFCWWIDTTSETHWRQKCALHFRKIAVVEQIHFHGIQLKVSPAESAEVSHFLLVPPRWLGLVRFLLLIIKGDECVLAWKGRWIASAPADCRLLCEWSGRPCPCRKHWLLPRLLPTRWLSKGYICIIICLIGGLLPGYGPSFYAMESALNLLQRYEGRDYKACKLPAHGFLLPNLITVCANKHFPAYARFFFLR